MRQSLYAIRANYRGITTVIVAVVTATQAFILVPEMMEPADEYPDFYEFVIPTISGCNPLNYPVNQYAGPARNPLYWWFYCASWQYTGFPNLLPTLFNVLVIPTVYLAATAMTKDRLAGIIAMSVFIYNPLYTAFNESAVYSMMWVFFLMLSVWLIYSAKGRTSLLFLVVASAAKGLVMLYYPAYLYSAIKNRQYVAGLVPLGLGLVLVFSLWYFYDLNQLVGNSIGFYPERLTDGLVRIVESIWPVLPFFVALIAVDRFFGAGVVKGKADVWVWMAVILASTPLIYVFTGQFQFGYRFVSLGAFISIYASIVVLQLGNFILNRRLAVTQ